MRVSLSLSVVPWREHSQSRDLRAFLVDATFRLSCFQEVILACVSY